jgi:hypothetical protein
MSFGRTTKLFDDLSMVCPTVDETSKRFVVRTIFVALLNKVGLVIARIAYFKNDQSYFI